MDELDRREHKDHLDLRDPLVRRDRKDRLDLEARLVYVESQDRLVWLVLWVLQVE